MRILFVTRGFPSQEDPMDGNYEAVQAKAIAKKGHEVSVIAIKWLNFLHILKCGKVNHRIEDGIHIYECNRIKLSIPHVYFPKIEQWAKQRQFKQVFEKYKREREVPDIVHAHTVMYAAPAIILKTEYHLPFIITEHWSRLFEKNTLRRVLNDTFSYQFADKVICVSNVLSESLKQKCHIDSIVINNMVDDKFFENRKRLSHTKCFKFIAVGALRYGKCFDLLVDAFALARFSENIYLDIVGEGEAREKIENAIRRNKLENRVRLLGIKTPEEVNDLLCSSDCFVLSSKLETFSIVLIEAMAKGLPVIATRCGGPETFVRMQDGLLVENENVEELSKAMKNMVAHYQEYDSDEIRQHCYDNFSQNVIADKIIEEYKRIIYI